MAGLRQFFQQQARHQASTASLEGKRITVDKKVQFGWETIWVGTSETTADRVMAEWQSRGWEMRKQAQ